MKYLVYTTYCSGRSGLSNGIMSIEVGVILAFLMDRVLILDGNVSPPANIVQYPGIISNQYPSTITDLLDLPIPWMNIEQVDLSRLDSKEFTSHSLGDSMFHFPPTLNLAQEDARWFAWSRKHFLTYGRWCEGDFGSHHAGWSRGWSAAVQNGESDVLFLFLLSGRPHKTPSC